LKKLLFYWETIKPEKERVKDKNRGGEQVDKGALLKKKGFYRHDFTTRK
jgi:hypothetical protein